jgi:cytochrome c oxidase subunit 2
MIGSFSLPEASAYAPEIDALLGTLLLTSAAVLALVFGLMLVYVVRYRASNPRDRGTISKKSWRFEIAWTAATLLVFFGLFLWGADLYVRLFQPPSDALRIYVVGKQWMWKVEHAGGQREIDALHVPVNRPIELLMTSEDVIHDFSVPAFRIKHDVLPGRYESLWFRSDRPGHYHLFCTQFCGTDHAAMTGEIIVLSGPDYQRWLETSPGSTDLVADGERLFSRYGCSGCHRAGLAGGGGSVRAPSMNGLSGAPVPLADGSTVLADDRYIRNAILSPRTQTVAGYDPVMPSFNGVISEEDLLRIVAYIQSLAGQS